MISISIDEIQVLTYRDPEHPERNCWVRLVFDGHECDGTSKKTQIENRLLAARDLMNEIANQNDGIEHPDLPSSKRSKHYRQIRSSLAVSGKWFGIIKTCAGTTISNALVKKWVNDILIPTLNLPNKAALASR